MNHRRAWAIAHKEFLHVLRDPRSLAMAIAMPMLLLMLYGYALTLDVDNVPTVVWDQSGTPARRDFISRFGGSRYFSIEDYGRNYRELEREIDSGRALVALVVPRGFGGQVRSGRPASAQLIVDGTDSNTAGIVLGYSNTVVQQFSQTILAERTHRIRGTWFNENLESRNYFVPGVIALMITLLTLLLTSMAVVREKEIGTMEQIMVTPIRPVEFILGKSVPFALISFVDLVLVTLVGVLWFQIPIRGSFALLVFATSVYLMTMLGIGLLISTGSQTQQQAMMSTFFFFMPALLLSGFMFPIASMPVAVQWLTYLNPMRYVMVILRGIFLKGVGFIILWPQIAALAVQGVFTLGVASRRFRKTLA
jgi:drug efflux transport system permease protein